jgi:Ni,Fe-hydrogenase maturation factor
MKKGKRLFNIYVLGNPLVEEDSLPLRLLPELKKKFSNIHFIELDPTETFPEEEHFVIIDTILNTEKAVLLNNIDKIQFQTQFSLHDFDLGFNLKLMKKLGKIKDISIIGLPPQIDPKEALEQIGKIIREQVLNKKKE